MKPWILHRLIPLWLGVCAALPAKDATVDDLLAVQMRVQGALESARKALVVLECDGGTASGIIVNAAGLVLTAAHVTTGPGKKIKVILHDGKSVEANSLGLDETTDAAMLQLPKPVRAWPFAPISREMRTLKIGDWCFALGHPGGWDAARGAVLRVGKLVKISPNMLQSDCVLMGGDSGGALFNLAGEVIGINSQIWKGRDQNLHVSMAPFLRSWEQMKHGDVINVWQVGNGAWIGLSTEASAGGLRVQAVAPESPALKAGIKQGEIIVSLDNRPLAAPTEFSDAIRGRTANEIVTLKLRGEAGERIVEVKLGTRPKE